jgi:uncharacterized protein YgiM (DUF1202 family)
LTETLTSVPSATAAATDAGNQAAGATPRVDTFTCEDLSSETNASITCAGGYQNALQESVRGNIYVHMIALDGQFLTSPGEIGNQTVLDMGVIQAVDVSGFLPNGVPATSFASPMLLCLRGVGEVIFLNAATSARTPERLPVTIQGAYSCVSVLGAGTVILVGSTSGLPEPPQPTAAVTPIIGICRVTTTDAPLNLRAEPNLDAVVLAQLPYNLTLTATARVPGWYQVIYLDMQGWVSASYVSAVGDCGQ